MTSVIELNLGSDVSLDLTERFYQQWEDALNQSAIPDLLVLTTGDSDNVLISTEGALDIVIDRIQKCTLFTSLSYLLEFTIIPSISEYAITALNEHYQTPPKAFLIYDDFSKGYIVYMVSMAGIRVCIDIHITGDDKTDIVKDLFREDYISQVDYQTLPKSPQDAKLAEDDFTSIFNWLTIKKGKDIIVTVGYIRDEIELTPLRIDRTLKESHLELLPNSVLINMLYSAVSIGRIPHDLELAYDYNYYILDSVNQGLFKVYLMSLNVNPMVRKIRELNDEIGGITATEFQNVYELCKEIMPMHNYKFNEELFEILDHVLGDGYSDD